MCIAAWIWQVHPLYPLLLLFNRDEYHCRETEPVNWWENDEILGGRDLVAGGTWLACTKEGRLAFLTNFREPDSIPNAQSRGDLIVRFLKSTKTPIEYAEEILEERDKYNGFNLIVADLVSKTMAYVTNRPKGDRILVQVVSPGLHVLSNATLDSPWPKCERLGKNFKELTQQYGDEELLLSKIVEQLMRDTLKTDKEILPVTGVDPDWEHVLSSIFVDAENTRFLKSIKLVSEQRDPSTRRILGSN